MEEENKEITRKEYSDFREALDAVKEYLFNNGCSSLSLVILRRLEETSSPVLEKIKQNIPKRTRTRLDSDKEFYGN